MVLGKTEAGKYYIHPCGQCLACRINDTRHWFVRSFFECKYSDRDYHYFLTLTYSNDFLPEDGLCNKVEAKKFLNNFNTTYGLNLRYFFTSDYGTVNNRPHYHAILLSRKKISTKMVEKIWRKGFVKIKPLTPESIKYCLRYTVKKTPFDGSLEGWFRLISLGWGAEFLKHYHGQKILQIGGRKYAIPPYYVKKLGIETKHLDKSDYFDSIYVHYRDVMDNDTRALTDLKQQYFYKRRYNVEALS